MYEHTCLEDVLVVLYQERHEAMHICFCKSPPTRPQDHMTEEAQKLVGHNEYQAGTSLYCLTIDS